MEKYWKSNGDRPFRDRVHIVENGSATLCGFDVIEKEMTQLTTPQMKEGEIPMCSRCIAAVRSIDPDRADTYPKHNPLRMQKNKSKYVKNVKLPKKYNDEIANPKLTKFKSIINSAKEQKIAISSAIESALETEEIPAMQQLKQMMVDLEVVTERATKEAHDKWESDNNKFNDTKHFHIITALRNFSMAIASIKEI